jgi:hypothetical protein
MDFISHPYVILTRESLLFSTTVRAYSGFGVFFRIRRRSVHLCIKVEE